ncbi:MAG: CoA transferase [Gemmatimonadota bacterium]
MQPLRGLRVVDLSQNLAGPSCGQILADLGADVIKVEPLEGDAARAWGPPFWGPDSALFHVANRGKRSLALDLKDAEGMAALRRLVTSADVFLQAFRAGVVERLGLDYGTLRELKPDLIYVTVSAFGPEGPRSRDPGYDPLMQAYSGLMSMTGQPGSPPSRVGASVIDAGTGMWGAIGVLAALRERDHTGEGTHVTVSLLDTALGLVSYKLTGYLADGRVPGPMGSAFGSIAPYESFPTSDGSVMIAAANDGIFQRLCIALQLPDLAQDARYQTNPSRVAHREELVQAIATHTRGLSSIALMARLKAHSVPFSPIHDMAQVATDEQVAATGMLRTPGHPRVEGYRDIAFPVRFDGERPAAEGAPPLIGEGGRALLEELGYTSAEIDALLERRVLHVPNGTD